MRLVVLRSQTSEDAQKPDDKFLQEFNTHYAQRVVGNLQSADTFCASCSTDCDHCRRPYHRMFGKDLAAVIDLPSVLPYLIENPAKYVPRSLPAHDILLIVHIHEQILLDVLKRCREWGTKGVVVPLEAPHWITAAVRAQAREICKAQGIEIEFPKPFCAFQPTQGSLLDQFMRHFHIGRPEVELTVRDGKIEKADVKVSAACGATYYVARWLVGRSVTDNLEIEVISKRMHAYPCTASMQRDPELHDDTPLHIAGIAHRDIIAPLMGKPVAEEKPDLVASPMGKMLPKPVPAKENQKGIEAAQEFVLNEFRNGSSLGFEDLKKKAGDLTPASLISALLLLKREGRIPAEGRKAVKRQDRQGSEGTKRD